MFSIIETLQNYFTHELLPDYLSSELTLPFYVKLVAAIFSGKLFGESISVGRWISHP